MRTASNMDRWWEWREVVMVTTVIRVVAARLVTGSYARTVATRSRISRLKAGSKATRTLPDPLPGRLDRL